MNKTNVFKSSEFYMGVGDILHMIILEESDIFPDIELVNGDTGGVEDGTLSPPVANVATDQTASSFVANWEAANFAEGYYLDVATDSAFTSMVAGFDGLDVGDVTSYLVDGLPDDTYYYRIRSYRDDEESESSNVIEVAGVSWDFGYLYTKAASDDVREIAASGWHVPTEDDFDDLQMELDPWEFTALPLMDTNPMYWESGLGTNELKFNARGAGEATEYEFTPLTTMLRLWLRNSGTIKSIDIEDNGVFDDGATETNAISIRLVKDSTVLTHGQTSVGAYTGNDGKTYDSVCIGTKEWLSQNLAETKFSSSFKVIYGALYNWYAATDVRNIANSGWHVPDVWTDIITLYNFLIADGGSLKEIGLIYWNAPNMGATNSSEFNGRGAGERTALGVFSNIRDIAHFWNTDEINASAGYAFWLSNNSAAFNILQNISKKYGMSIRLVKDSTTLTHGQTGTYTGNDGKVYRTICIGTQEWLADNLCETQFRDTAVKYGALYNWYAATDVREITAAGWSVPTYAEWTTLYEYLGGTYSSGFFAIPNVAGGKLKEVGNVYWDDNVGATNELGFNGRGSALREIAGVFNSLKSYSKYITATASVFPSSYYAITIEKTTANLQSQFDDKRMGASIRLFRPATEAEQLLDDGTACEPYQGNDLKLYRTVKIGTQVWLACNLCETKFRNGEVISEVTDNAAWAALETAGMCYYDNDIDNAIWDVNIEEVTDAGSWAAIETSAMCSYNNDTDYSYIDSDDITSALLSGSPDFDEPLRLAYDDNEAYV